MFSLCFGAYSDHEKNMLPRGMSLGQQADFHFQIVQIVVCDCGLQLAGPPMRVSPTLCPISLE